MQRLNVARETSVFLHVIAEAGGDRMETPNPLRNLYSNDVEVRPLDRSVKTNLEFPIDVPRCESFAGRHLA
jgi:hypothetical protein